MQKIAKRSLIMRGINLKFKFILSLACSGFAGEICYDLNMSPYAGANNLLFVTEIAELYQPFSECTSWTTRIARLSELILFYLPVNYFASIVQHEVFGHGYRIRNIHHGIVTVAGYNFSFPPPYGPGDASTHFYLDPNKITTTDLTCISIAGFEAQSILANVTKCKWLEEGSIDARETILYLVSQFGINLYASGDNEDFGHDLVGYLYPLNMTYTDAFLTEDRIRALSWMNLIDPFAYFSAFSWFCYLTSGTKTSIPMISIGDFGYLFGARLGLTPFGPEYYLDQYLLQENRPIYFYLKAGVHAKNSYLGAGAYVPHFFQKNNWTLGFRLDVWRQPKLLLFGMPPYSSGKQHHMHFGIAPSVICAYQKNRFLGLKAEIGYKTPGYLPGYSLYAQPTLRLSYFSSF